MEIIRKLSTPREAFQMARDPTVSQWKRKDWEDVKDGIMLGALRCKFTQHANLGKKLVETRDKRLVEHTANDSYWADGGDGSGENKLGKLLMQVRSELQASGQYHVDTSARGRSSTFSSSTSAQNLRSGRSRGASFSIPKPFPRKPDYSSVRLLSVTQLSSSKSAVHAPAGTSASSHQTNPNYPMQIGSGIQQYPTSMTTHTRQYSSTGQRKYTNESSVHYNIISGQCKYQS